MALRWLLRIISTQMVGRSDDGGGDGGCSREAKGVRMAGGREEKGTCRRVNGGYDGGFMMPLHYPRYRKEEYEAMEEWKVDMVLKEYGLAFDGSLEEKRAYAIGAFLWPDEL